MLFGINKSANQNINKKDTERNCYLSMYIATHSRLKTDMQRGWSYRHLHLNLQIILKTDCGQNSQAQENTAVHK
jgi:hypothetical protein